MSVVCFNASTSLLTAATQNGFQLFVPSGSGETRRIVSVAMGAVHAAATIDDTTLIALMLDGGRVLQLFDYKAQSPLSEVFFETPAITVKATRDRLVVVFDRCLHIFDVDTMEPLPQVRTTKPVNKNGIIAVAGTAKGPTYAAFPQMKDEALGECFILDILNPSKLSVVAAHNNSITAVTMNKDGSVLATASAKGTLFRVYSNPNPQHLHTFRRGTQDATIHSLVLSPSGGMLMASSNTSTLHLWRINKDGIGAGKEESSWKQFKVESSSSSNARLVASKDGNGGGGVRTIGGILEESRCLFLATVGNGPIEVTRFSIEGGEKGSLCATIQ